MLLQGAPLSAPQGEGQLGLLWGGGGLGFIDPQGLRPLSQHKPRCVTVSKIKGT